MNVTNFINEAGLRGVDLFLVDGQLKLGIKSGVDIDNDIVDAAKKHKAEIIAALSKCNVVDIAKERLKRLSHETNINYDELVGWYKNDLHDFGREPPETLKACVLDYKKYQSEYKRLTIKSTQPTNQ